jgi:hypothetical protein
MDRIKITPAITTKPVAAKYKNDETNPFRRIRMTIIRIHDIYDIWNCG